VVGAECVGVVIIDKRGAPFFEAFIVERDARKIVVDVFEELCVCAGRATSVSNLFETEEAKWVVVDGGRCLTPCLVATTAAKHVVFIRFVPIMIFVARIAKSLVFSDTSIGVMEGRRQNGAGQVVESTCVGPFEIIPSLRSVFCGQSEDDVNIIAAETGRNLRLAMTDGGQGLLQK